jgi:hypothetical protein
MNEKNVLPNQSTDAARASAPLDYKQQSKRVKVEHACLDVFHAIGEWAQSHNDPHFLIVWQESEKHLLTCPEADDKWAARIATASLLTLCIDSPPPRGTVNYEIVRAIMVFNTLITLLKNHDFGEPLSADAEMILAIVPQLTIISKEKKCLIPNTAL